MDVMHTFGRDVKFSPHIHVLLTCGGLDKSETQWVKCNFLPEAYFKKLAAASDRALLTEIGKTEEGRAQFMMIVTSPENLKKLDRYKSISQQLAHAENLTDEQAHALAAGLLVFAFLVVLTTLLLGRGLTKVQP